MQFRPLKLTQEETVLVGSYTSPLGGDFDNAGRLRMGTGDQRRTKRQSCL
jgi:hypothetical protein